MNSVAISLIAFAVILCGASVGALLRKPLPDRLLTDDTKDIVRLGAGLIGTMAALVLGLLIASAKSSYDAQRNQVQHLTADVILLDQLLAQYGQEARPVRELNRLVVVALVERLWRENSSVAAKNAPYAITAVGEEAFAKVGELAPQTDAQRSLKARAVQASTDMLQTRLTLFTQAGSSIPMPFLAVLVFWLAIIFASFCLFARLNPILIGALIVFALSASAALFLILEMSQPFAGLMQIPSAPLSNALAPLD